MSTQNEPNTGRFKPLPGEDAADSRPRGKTVAPKPDYRKTPYRQISFNNRQTSSKTRGATRQQSEADIEHDLTSPTDMAVDEKGLASKHVERTVQLLTMVLESLVAVANSTEEDTPFDELVEPIRRISHEIAIFVAPADGPASKHEPEDHSVTALLQTNAEQASALAQNANSIATLTRILDSKFSSAAPDNAHAGRTNTTPHNDLSASIHAPATWSTSMKRSANPLPIKPSPKKKADSLPSNPSQRNHSRRLLIEFFPKVESAKREVGRSMVSKINDALAQANARQEDRIDAIQYSLNGNTIIITGESTSAEAMKDHYALIASLISPNQFKAHPDHVYHRVKLDRVPTYIDDHRATIQQVAEELADKWAGFKDLAVRGQPSWLGYESVLALQSSASISFSFASEEDATKFRNQGVFYLFGTSCRTSRFVERPQVYYCNLCGSMDHRTDACQTGAMCNTCTSLEHTTDNHPVEMTKKCVNCAGDHEARSKVCDARTKRLGKQKTSGDDTPSGGGKPTNRKRVAKANGNEVTHTPVSSQPKTAESRRERESKLDHVDLELRKAHRALVVEAERRRQENQDEGERARGDRMAIDQTVYSESSARVGKKPESDYSPPKSKLVDANLRLPANGASPPVNAIN